MSGPNARHLLAMSRWRAFLLCYARSIGGAMELREFLIWLASSGGAAIALSFIAERNEKFKSLSSANKQYIQLGGSLVLALSAYAVMTYVPQSVLDAMVPWFQIVAGVLAPMVINQLAHKADPARVEPVVVVKVTPPPDVGTVVPPLTEQDLPMRSRGERA